MSERTFKKDPGERLDYGFDLTDWLTDAEVVAEGTVVVTQDPVDTLTIENEFTDGQRIGAYISGGTVGDRVRVSFHAETDSVPARIFERSLTISVQQR